MNMGRITIAYAVILILIGLIGYLGSGMVSITALIPAFFGAVFLVLGVMAFFENMRKNAMHAASILALIGIIFTIGGIFGVGKMLGGEQIARPGAAVTKAIMAIFSIVYFVICLWSFVSARLLKKKDDTDDLAV